MRSNASSTAHTHTQETQREGALHLQKAALWPSWLLSVGGIGGEGGPNRPPHTAAASEVEQRGRACVCVLCGRGGGGRGVRACVVLCVCCCVVHVCIALKCAKQYQKRGGAQANLRGDVAPATEQTRSLSLWVFLTRLSMTLLSLLSLSGARRWRRRRAKKMSAAGRAPASIKPFGAPRAQNLFALAGGKKGGKK